MMVQLMRNRLIWAALSAIAGFLQAWDSNALDAGAFAGALIAAGMLLPATAIAASAHWGYTLGALIAGAVLLTWARIITPVSLNGLHIGLFVPAVYVFFVSRMAAALPPAGQP